MHLNSNSFNLSLFLGGIKSQNSERSNIARKGFLSKLEAKNYPKILAGLIKGSISLILHLGH